MLRCFFMLTWWSVLEEGGDGLVLLHALRLPPQDHYDFGMRAVKSVLVMAGSLKRSNPDLSEDVVLIRAMRDSNLPKFLVSLCVCVCFDFVCTSSLFICPSD